MAGIYKSRPVAKKRKLELHAATFTLTSNPTAGETVTIGSVVYTFRASLAAAYDVLIGAAGTNTRDNLLNAINKGAGEGSTYGTGTVQHAQVVAASNGSLAIDLSARKTTAATGTVALAETSGVASWNRAIMADGSFYSFPLPVSAASYLSMQYGWDATLVFTASLETTNIPDDALGNDDATGTDWFAESGVSLTVPAGGSAGTTMTHLSGIVARRARVKMTCTTAGELAGLWTHGKE